MLLNKQIDLYIASRVCLSKLGQVLKVTKYLQINTWAFPYWPGYHPETPILARNAVDIAENLLSLR